MWETISVIGNLVLGSGLIITLATLRSARRKAAAESESEYMELSKVYVDEFQANIVSPLKQTLDDNKKEMAALKREMARLRRAIEKSTSCDYSGDCPVRRELQKLETADN